MVIKVLQSHINAARKHEENYTNSSSNCPVALAMSAATGQKIVNVGYNVATLKRKDISLPKKVQDFILKFDHGDKVKPFTFTI